MWWLKLLLLGVKWFNLPGSTQSGDPVNRKHIMAGMISYGRVTTVDPATSKLTATFNDRNFQSGPIQFLQRSCYGAQSYENPSEGDTCVCLHPANYVERGLVIGFVYTNQNPPPWNNINWRGILFPDGSYVVYDSDAKNYILNLQGKVTLTTVGDVLATVGGKLTANVTGAIDIEGQSTGKFNAQGGLSLNGVQILADGTTTFPKDVTIDGNLTTDGNSQAGSRSGGII